MKSKRIITMLAAFLLLSCGVKGWAAQSVNISVRLEVPSLTPSITVDLLQIDDGDPDNNPWTGSWLVGNMDFGQLTYTLDNGKSAGGWYSKRMYCAVIYVTPYGSPYEITSTCAGLSSGANTLPAESFMLSPNYSENDQWDENNANSKQGPIPAGARLGSATSAVGTNKLIYSSEAGRGTARIIQAYYSIPAKKADGSDPFAGHKMIPLDQPAGTYTGTVTISFVAK